MYVYIHFLFATLVSNCKQRKCLPCPFSFCVMFGLFSFFSFLRNGWIICITSYHTFCQARCDTVWTTVVWTNQWPMMTYLQLQEWFGCDSQREFISKEHWWLKQVSPDAAITSVLSEPQSISPKSKVWHERL